MKRTVTLRPGVRGTKRLAAQYGDQLMYVRYRYDGSVGKRFKTVELIVSERTWQPPSRDDVLVWIQIAPSEGVLRRAVMAKGGRWNPVLKLWEVQLKVIKELNLEDRISQGHD